MAVSNEDLKGYHYGSPSPSHTQVYLLPGVLRLLDGISSDGRIFEVGCGNGAMAGEIAKLGYHVTAVDPSVEGIRIARDNVKNCEFAVGSAYDDLSAHYGTFEAVVSLEVVEHVFYPRRYAKTIADLLAPGGIAVISTPYHGYLKNLALSVMNRWDSHMDPLWDYGHIKLWSQKKLDALFGEVGLVQTGFLRVGRIPQFAKSMILRYER